MKIWGPLLVKTDTGAVEIGVTAVGDKTARGAGYHGIGNVGDALPGATSEKIHIGKFLVGLLA